MPKSNPTIVVLDGHTLNPGDLSWERLDAHGELTVHDVTPPKEIVPRAQDAGIVLTNKTLLSRKTIGQLPGLKYVGVLATGYNVVDIDAARERGIPVCNVPAYGAKSVAQMVFAHVLNFAQGVAQHSNTVRAGQWNDRDHFCYWNQPLVELAGLTLGIVGLGEIGRQTAELGLAFGMHVVAYNPSPKQVLAGVRLSDLETVFRESDFLSLHCPLTSDNAQFVNDASLSLMKPSAILINTARGGLIDEQSLADALNQGRIAGAGLDVLSAEPPLADNPLLTAKNCMITPHIAWATWAARERLLNTAIDNVEAFLNGSPQNVVNG